MITKREVIDQARKLGFDDVGFTTADAFEAQQKVLSDRQENYSWLKEKGMDLIQGTDPKSTFPEAKSIIVLGQPAKNPLLFQWRDELVN